MRSVWARAILVALGGALGTAVRYAASGYLGRHFPSFPWGTLLVNMAGSFLLGFVMGASISGPYLLSPTLRSFLTIGFFGGLTTFSTLCYEILAAWRSGDGGRALSMLAANLILGLVVCFLGLTLGERS
ncbi:MAG: fluoride efflux transporter FluC [Thermoanaerobaculaceae bacterium]